MAYRWIASYGFTALIAAAVFHSIVAPDLSSIRFALLTVGSAALAVATLFVARYRQARAVSEISAGLKRLWEGYYGHKVYPGTAVAFSDLARNFNEASESLASRISELENDRRQLRAILGGLVEGVISVDGNQSINYLNERAIQLLNLGSSPMAHRKLWEVVRDRPLLEIVEAAIRQGTSQRVELDWKGPPARSLSVYIVRLSGAATTGAIIVINDISELRRLERVRQEFVGNVSHELKTPLSVIQISVETLINGAVEDEKHRGAFLEQIQDQAARLDRLILDLLSLARIESGREAFEFRPIPLGQFVRECLDGLKSKAESKQHSIVVVPGPEVYAWADAESVETILTNLADNAIKYTPNQGTITFRWGQRDETVFVEVEDNGIGIPDRDQPRIFERFYRVDRARSREAGSTGLGLAIVKHLVQAMRGTVDFWSELGKGTRFVVRLPRSESEASAGEQRLTPTRNE